MSLENRASFEVLKQLGFASISVTYAAVGGPTTHPVRAFELINGTAGIMFFTITFDGNTPASDGTADEFLVLVGQSDQWNITSNTGNITSNPPFMIPVGSQFWVRSFSAATSGLVGVSCLIGVKGS